MQLVERKWKTLFSFRLNIGLYRKLAKFWYSCGKGINTFTNYEKQQDIRRFKMRFKIKKQNDKGIEEIWVQKKARNEVLYPKMYAKETATWGNLLCGLWLGFYGRT